MATDKSFGEFDNELQDEYTFDAHYPPGIEIGAEGSEYGDLPFDEELLPPIPEGFLPEVVEDQGPLIMQPDVGSGSCAEDGPLEVAEGRVIMDGENILGSAAMYGPTEIGDDDALGVAQKVAKAVQAVKKAQVAVKTAPPAVAAQHVAAAQQATAVAEHALASGPYASHGAMEIGAAAAADRAGSELGMAAEGGYIAKYGQSELGGPYAQDGAAEIGEMLGIPWEEEWSSGMKKKPTTKKLMSHLGAGHYPLDGASELGNYAEQGASEVGAGHYPLDGASELGAGHFASDGASEVGEQLMQPFETFMLEDQRLGESDDLGNGDDRGAGWGIDGSEIGAGWYPGEGASEIGVAQQKAAVVKVVEKARDNRKPPPPMKAVDVDAPLPDESDDFLSDIVIGAAVATGREPYPLLAQLLQRAGKTIEPRIVRVDTEESYKAYRTAQSPELSALAEKIDAHVSDPAAHNGIAEQDIDDDINDLVMLGEEVKAAEAQKRVDLWMPKRFEGKLEAWREGDVVCVSMALPGQDGFVRICTSFEPVVKCVDEMTRHAAEANVPAATVVGVLPAMGCVLGAGTVLKEVAAAAPAILARPEAKLKMPFMVRIEPKMAPHLAALVMLAAGCKEGNAQACAEWTQLSNASVGPVKQAMVEAVQILKAATGA